MMNDKEIMRAYVTGADHLQYTQLADGMVQLNATHSNLKQYVMELRLDLHTRIRDVKAKLLTHNGTSIEHMLLQLQDSDGTPLRMMDDDDKPLGFYSPQNGMNIHVIDTDPFSLSRDGGLDDVSRIAKYRMSEEDYDKRDNTLRSYKKKMLAQDPNFRFVPKSSSAAGGAHTLPVEEYQKEECVASLKVGDRCEVSPGARRGTVAFIGPVATLAAGYWVGVRLDEPLGKGDGSRGGITFFDCPDRYGAFVRPNFVTVGDFPEEGLEDELGELELNDANITSSSSSNSAPAVAVAASNNDDGCGSCACAHGNKQAAEPAAGQPPASTTTTSNKVALTAAKVGRRAADEDDDSDSEL